MDGASFGFVKLCVGLLGIGFGLGALARRAHGKPSRGPGDLLSACALMVFGAILVISGSSTWISDLMH